MMSIKLEIAIDLTARQKRVIRAAVVSGVVLSALGLGVVVAAPRHTFTSGTPISANQMNDNFVDLDSRIAVIEGRVVPAGSIVAYAGDVATLPAGWLLCDGSARSRSDIAFAQLFAKIGVRWGAGDGATTFNLPDLRGRFVRGVDAGAARDPDRNTRTGFNNGTGVGDNVGSLQADQFRLHSHSFNSYSDVGLNNGAPSPTFAVAAS